MPLTVKCNPIIDGQTTLVVNGTTRKYAAQLPANRSSDMAVLFLWHGWNQDPIKFRDEIVYDVGLGKWVRFDQNAFPMPLLIVSPYSTKQLPVIGKGLDWDIVDGAIDFPFFEGMLQCAKEQFKIDETRIYSMGFSAGSVFTSLLASKYPHTFAAIIAESGAWFNDPPEQKEISVGFLMSWNWPALNPADGGNVLLTHGGSGDYATVISLENTAKKALPFLYANKRTVVECAHTFGHTPDPDLTQKMYYDYLWAHKLGGPPLTALPPGFPTVQKPVGATSCKFHPYP